MKIEFQSIGILIKLYYNYYITIREEYYRTFKFYLANENCYYFNYRLWRIAAQAIETQDAE